MIQLAQRKKLIGLASDILLLAITGKDFRLFEFFFVCDRDND